MLSVRSCPQPHASNNVRSTLDQGRRHLNGEGQLVELSEMDLSIPSFWTLAFDPTCIRHCRVYGASSCCLAPPLTSLHFNPTSKPQSELQSPLSGQAWGNLCLTEKAEFQVTPLPQAAPEILSVWLKYTCVSLGIQAFKIKVRAIESPMLVCFFS